MRQALLFLSLFLTYGLSAQVVISEINYNNPGADDFEFLELTNTGSSAVDMAGYTFTSGITYAFPSVTVDPGEYVVLVGDAAAYTAAFGGSPLEWDNGSLSNGGESVVLVDASGVFADSVAYDDGAGWPTAADGDGPSLILCDLSTDNNDPANWQASTNATGVLAGAAMDEEIFASPGAANNCATDPQVGFLNTALTVNEDAGTVEGAVVISIGAGNATTVIIDVDEANSTASAADYDLDFPLTLTFDGAQADDTLTFSLPVIDDDEQESTETLVLTITSVDNNGAVFGAAGTYVLSIVDNDTPLTNAMVITGVFDAQPSGAGTKGIELQVVEDIPDASIFGVGSANNGGGTDGVEFVFPAIALPAGTCVHIANDSIDFVDFFGFDATFIDGVASINGDDAIELFENQQVIDVFGEIDVDGSGQAWEYLDGWAYRDNTTGPDGSTFVIENWNFSGNDALENVATNADAALPFPACAYTSMPPNELFANNDQAFTPANTAVTIDILNNDDVPDANGLTVTITMMPANGSATINGDTDAVYVPATDFCGQDQFVYQLTAADGSTSSAEVYVDVACPSSYPQRNIAELTTVDEDGLPDSIGVTAQISGLVYGVDLQGAAPVQFTVIDATGGIAVFSSDDFGYTVMEGDEVTLEGTVSQFNGLTQFTPDTIILVSTGNDLQDPTDVTSLGEDTESELVKLCGLQYVSASLGTSGNNYTFTDGTTEFTVRVDNDTELFDNIDFEVDPSGTEYCITGIGGQFDNSIPYTEGYQLLPRFNSDIQIITGTTAVDYSTDITYFPHPLQDVIELRTDLTLERMTLRNQLGQTLLVQPGNARRIDVSALPAGLYLLSFHTAEGVWSTPVVK